METRSYRDRQPVALSTSSRAPRGPRDKRSSSRVEGRREVRRLELSVVLLAFSAAGLGAALARGAWIWVAVDSLLVATALALTLKRLGRLFDRMLMAELFSQEARALARKLFFSPN
ncbi:MAG: hypothetical protein ACRDJG_12825 [Actinomycetota bacterium]